MSMKITTSGGFLIGRLCDKSLSDRDRSALLALANEETADELLCLMAEAEALADPKVIFGVCAVKACDSATIQINGTAVDSPLVWEKLKDKKRCFPYVATCGVELEAWSERYRDDLLTEFWADEIKKLYLQRIGVRLFGYLRERYRSAEHLPALNPGSLKDWPLGGQRELFEILGGRELVENQIGVVYTESFLMLPSKSISGIAFESDAFYENCQYCPLTNCPNRRAAAVCNAGDGAAIDG